MIKEIIISISLFLITLFFYRLILYENFNLLYLYTFKRNIYNECVNMNNPKIFSIFKKITNSKLWSEVKHFETIYEPKIRLNILKKYDFDIHVELEDLECTICKQIDITIALFISKLQPLLDIKDPKLMIKNISVGVKQYLYCKTILSDKKYIFLDLKPSNNVQLQIFILIYFVLYTEYIIYSSDYIEELNSIVEDFLRIIESTFNLEYSNLDKIIYSEEIFENFQKYKESILDMSKLKTLKIIENKTLLRVINELSQNRHLIKILTKRYINNRLFLLEKIINFKTFKIFFEEISSKKHQWYATYIILLVLKKLLNSIILLFDLLILIIVLFLKPEKNYFFIMKSSILLCFISLFFIFYQNIII